MSTKQLAEHDFGAAAGPTSTGITLHCVADRMTTAYHHYMLRSATKLSVGQFGMSDVLYHPKGTGSSGHGEGLKMALTNAATQDHRGCTNIIVDSDVVFLMKGWNTWLLRTLEAEEVVGATYEDVGCFSSGNGPVQTYKDRPNLVLFAWSPHVEMATLDPMPAKGDVLMVDSDELAKRYRLPIGSQVLCDVGWQIPGHLDKQGITGLGLKNLRLNTLAGFEDVHPSCELFVTPDGVPFAAHQRGSSRSPFRGDDISRGFYDACDRIIGRLP